MGMFLPIFVCLRFHIKCIAMASTTSKKSSRSSSDSSKALSLLATTTSIWAVVFKHTVITWGSLRKKKKQILQVLYLGYLVSKQQRIIIWLGELLCLYLHCTCRIMKQTEGCDETKMISEGEDDGFRGRGREREGKIHLNAVMVCLLNPIQWMDGTHCTTAYFNMYKPPPQLDKCQSAEQVAAYKFKLWLDQHLGS